MAEDQAELDTGRLGALAEHLGETPESIAGTLHDELQRAFAELDAALAAGDREAAGRAGHAARNSALMITARPMLDGLRAVEAALADGNLAGARAAREGLAGHWSAVARALRADL
jgi:hypothetical protein